MKNKYILAAMGAMMLYAGQAYAITQTKPMQVSLNNIAAVTVSTSAVNFGDITTNTLFPTATGSITVNATIGAVYTISIDAGQHQSNVNGVCRNVSASLTVQRGYQTYTDSALTTAWGDSDTQATCPSTTSLAGGGASVSGTGTGVSQLRPVHFKAFAGNKIGLMTDILTVTVVY
ncbi:spore coat protein U domain-containing protein [Mariprofundus ferrooxydans]|nr:spore coat protein U domain-containing protein [Mariprofundus ferrooxydans]